MKLAGIDGVIVDWYGSADFLDYGLNNQATVRLFQFTRKAGLKFSICYEDQTLQHMIDGNFLAAATPFITPSRKCSTCKRLSFRSRVICGCRGSRCC